MGCLGLQILIFNTVGLQIRQNFLGANPTDHPWWKRDFSFPLCLCNSM